MSPTQMSALASILSIAMPPGEMVASTPQFTEQHLVINGFSDLIRDVFGSTSTAMRVQRLGPHLRPWVL